MVRYFTALPRAPGAGGELREPAAGHRRPVDHPPPAVVLAGQDDGPAVGAPGVKVVEMTVPARVLGAVVDADLGDRRQHRDRGPLVDAGASVGQPAGWPATAGADGAATTAAVVAATRRVARRDSETMDTGGCPFPKITTSRSYGSCGFDTPRCLSTILARRGARRVRFREVRAPAAAAPLDVRSAGAPRGGLRHSGRCGQTATWLPRSGSSRRTCAAAAGSRCRGPPARSRRTAGSGWGTRGTFGDARR